MNFYFAEYKTLHDNDPDVYTPYASECGRHSLRDVEDIKVFTVQCYWLLFLWPAYTRAWQAKEETNSSLWTNLKTTWSCSRLGEAS